ncbi:MAG: hypothetical protein HGGPFJEG_00322 [Ignavibacteria bacterium]|nr:hypothetical protein [Ignavibacteria bacterium]
MKTIFIHSSFAILILVSSFLNALSQEKKIYKGEVPANLVKEELINKKAERQNFKTREMTLLESEMKTAKEKGDKNEVINLQKEYDAISGSVTKPPKKIDMKRIKPEEAGFDNIYTNTIFSTNDHFSIVDMATATDQRGSNTGRIWTVWIGVEDEFVYGASSLGLAYSDDNGLTWTVQYLYTFGEYWNVSEIDIEYLEDNSDNNFVWIVCNPNVLLIVNLNNGASNAYEMLWPLNYYGGFLSPRIVSDNARYPDIPFIYIVIKQWVQPDPNINEYHVVEATAKCVSPLTSSPSISYGAWYITYPDVYIYGIPDYTTDIAYFRNGSNDSVVILINNTSNQIDIYTHSIFSFNAYTAPNYIGNLNPNSYMNPKQRAYLATNGGYNKIMIVYKKFYDVYDWDVAYYRSTNGTAGWLQGYVDFSAANVFGDARIIGERNDGGKFHVAYINEQNSEISYASSDNYLWNPRIFPYSNLRSYGSSDPYKENIGNPAPGYYQTFFNSGCMAVWLDSTGKNIWSSSGCSGPFSQPTKELFLFGAIQGLYDPVADEMLDDTVTVYLRNSISPFAKIDSSRKELYGPGTGQYFSFNNAQNNIPYYVEVKHRNALETWSADPVTFVNENSSIAFSVDAIYAFGNNEIQVDSSPYNVFAFFSGDVNQDGVIDATDAGAIDNDAFNFMTGYVNTDLTGDDVVDATDAAIADNNAFNFVGKVTP